ncbi:non-specific lipid transfer protein GPI-anchored 31-like [Rutidosis leptorrhynchoides]|uniref:non-specific lipid transfer protein GPI-anchored 31-like n=1 Tax=Rutidosis leptorrhynchoides TaxID=125765 RepID=UPI003A9A524F
MATTTTVLFLYITAVMINVCVVDSAHHTAAPAPAADCSSVILSMADCLSYVTAGSTIQKPEGTCCSGLKTVLKTDAQCLCESFKNSAQFGIQLNITKALALPAACKIKAPSATNCGMSLGTAAAPVQSPMGVGMAPTMAASGPSTAVAPTPASQNSGSSGLAMSTMAVFVSVLLSVYLYSY